MRLKSTVTWDVTSCSLVEWNPRFGGTCTFHLQGRVVSCAIQFGHGYRGRKGTGIVSKQQITVGRPKYFRWQDVREMVQ
jgi:hypothetical protein